MHTVTALFALSDAVPMFLTVIIPVSLMAIENAIPP